MMGVVQVAVGRFESGQCCSQAVFSAFAQQLGMDYEDAVKIAAGFGGGLGRMAGTCGAVTGACMALGLKFGGADAESREKTYALVREFAERFKARCGTIECKQLLGCDISTPAGHALAKEKKLFATLCVDIVRTAAEIAEDMLDKSD